MRTRHLNRLMIVAILVISTAPLNAQDQQQNASKLEVEARHAIDVVGADKHKTQIYCRILELERQKNHQETNKTKKRNKNKAEALSQKINQLERQLGPEFVALDDILKDLDLSSIEGREIALMIQSLVQACPD